MNLTNLRSTKCKNSFVCVCVYVCVCVCLWAHTDTIPRKRCLSWSRCHGLTTNYGSHGNFKTHGYHFFNPGMLGIYLSRKGTPHDWKTVYAISKEWLLAKRHAFPLGNATNEAEFYRSQFTMITRLIHDHMWRQGNWYSTNTTFQAHFDLLLDDSWHIARLRWNLSQSCIVNCYRHIGK